MGSERGLRGVCGLGLLECPFGRDQENGSSLRESEPRDTSLQDPGTPYQRDCHSFLSLRRSRRIWKRVGGSGLSSESAWSLFPSTASCVGMSSSEEAAMAATVQEQVLGRRGSLRNSDALNPQTGLKLLSNYFQTGLKLLSNWSDPIQSHSISLNLAPEF